MSGELTYNFKEHVVAAKFIGASVLFVEGKDDISVYKRIADDLGKKIEVLAADAIYHSGKNCCRVEFIVDNIVQNLGPNEKLLEKRFLGIVDGDAKKYRGGVRNKPNLLELNLYSIESYFISRKLVVDLLKHTTSSYGMITKPTVKYVLDEMCKNIKNDLYYPALDALYGSCEASYTSTYEYKLEWGQFNHKKQFFSLDNVKGLLDTFSASRKIECCWEDILKICKGKWVLRYFIERYRDVVVNLPTLCSSGRIKSCMYRSCPDHSDKCLYKSEKASIQESVLENFIRKSHLNNIFFLKKKIQALA